MTHRIAASALVAAALISAAGCSTTGSTAGKPEPMVVGIDNKVTWGADGKVQKIPLTTPPPQKKKRGLLAYTPVGFVVSTGVQALRDFTDKYDILDLALQVEVQDSVRHDVLGAAVVQRGRSVERGKPLSFDALNALVTEYGERTACRLDNSHVSADRRIDCHDAEARRQRPRVLGQ